MIIQEIKYHKNSCDLIVDDVLYKKESLLVLEQFRLKKNMEISQSKFSEFLTESEKVRCKDKLIAMLSMGSYSEKEVRIKLSTRGFSMGSINLAIETAKGYGYINDVAFAKSYADNNSGSKGAYRIKQELRQKGIADSAIEDVTASLKDDEGESAKNMAEKFMRNKDTDPKTIEKLFRHLASRGFGYDSIKEAISNIGAETDIEE